MVSIQEARQILAKNKDSYDRIIQHLTEYEYLDEDHEETNQTVENALAEYLDDSFNNILDEIGIWVDEIKVIP